MAEISVGYGQKVSLERRGDHLVIGLHDGEGTKRATLAEIGILPGEFDLLWQAYEAERGGCEDCYHSWSRHDWAGCHEEGCVCGNEPPGHASMDAAEGSKP